MIEPTLKFTHLLSIEKSFHFYQTLFILSPLDSFLTN